MYARQQTYNQIGGQNVSQQQQIQQQQAMMQGMRNIQVQNLTKAYPGLTLHKKTDVVEEFKVPLKLPVSEQPLFIKVSLTPDFPLTRPNISVMSRVQQKNVEANTFQYKGSCLMNWNDNASLAQVVQEIHEEFQKHPPIPLSMQGVVVQRQQYQPEQVTLNRPTFSDLRSQVNQMTPQDQENLKQNQEMLLNMMLSDKEAEPLKLEITKHLEDVKRLAQSNLQQKVELMQLANQYDMKYAQYQSLKEQNDKLGQQEQLILNKMSKQKIVSVLDQKVNRTDAECKQVEKSFYKGDLDQKHFINGYLKSRKDFHKYSIMKVKVNLS